MAKTKLNYPLRHICHVAKLGLILDSTKKKQFPSFYVEVFKLNSN